VLAHSEVLRHAKEQGKLTVIEAEYPPMLFYWKNTPLTTAFDPPVRVTLIFTCPEMFQTKYIPLEKLEMLLVSNTALVFASRI
jgi:hypothetical protein